MAVKKKKGNRVVTIIFIPSPFHLLKVLEKNLSPWKKKYFFAFTKNILQIFLKKFELYLK